MSHTWKGWQGWQIASWPTQDSKNRSWYDIFCFQWYLSCYLLVHFYCKFLVGHFICNVLLIFFETGEWEGFTASVWKEKTRVVEVNNLHVSYKGRAKKTGLLEVLSTNDLQVMDHSKMAHQHWTLVTWRRYHPSLSDQNIRACEVSYSVVSVLAEAQLDTRDYMQLYSIIFQCVSILIYIYIRIYYIYIYSYADSKS